MVLILELNESATFSKKTPSFFSLTSIPSSNILENALGKNPLSALIMGFPPIGRILSCINLFFNKGSFLARLPSSPLSKSPLDCRFPRGLLGVGIIEVIEFGWSGWSEPRPIPFFPDFAFFKRAAIIFLAINCVKSPVYVFCIDAIILYTLLS